MVRRVLTVAEVVQTFGDSLTCAEKTLGEFRYLKIKLRQSLGVAGQTVSVKRVGQQLRQRARLA